MPASSRFSGLTRTHWLIIIVAIIGFAFDTYELLMLPLIAGPALAELLQVPPNNPLVTDWVGRMLWITALCGGVFGLLGGWLTDTLGRKTVMAGSIMLYSLSPVMAALSTSLPWFLTFRCTTFVGVCVEFVAAITWLAEVFPDKKQKEFVLGFTQAFASIGGLLVTGANVLTVKYGAVLPALPVPEPFNAHAFWRYTLMTGLLPAIPIALMLPFVPESQAWLERRRAGTLRRPRLGELFSPQLRRTTIATAALSACAYGAAFGALQLTPTRIVPGLPDLAAHRDALKPLQAEAKGLNQQLNQATPAAAAAMEQVPGLRELSGLRAKARQAMRAARQGIENKETPEPRKAELRTQLSSLTNRFAELEAQLGKLTQSKPDARKALLEREKIMGQLAGNREKQEPHDKPVKERANQVQFSQELGGLAGRIVLAMLVITAIPRRLLLRIFQVPGLVALPLTYLFLYKNEPGLFALGVGFCGLLTVAQFSYFGEYLPRVFPIHLRGTGGSFATNVGGRMLGTSAAYVTTSVIAPRLSGSTFEQVATAAGIVGTAVFLIGLAFSFVLPEPKAESHE